MSKKQLNTENVLSELTGQSAFFRKETTSPVSTQPIAPKPKPQSQTERTEIRTDNRTEIRSDDRFARLPLKRLTRRYSFEFYNDQITRLKGIKHEYEMMGENLTMSDIVREALDEYLLKNDTADRTENRSEVRTNENPNG